MAQDRKSPEYRAHRRNWYIGARKRILVKLALKRADPKYAKFYMLKDAKRRANQKNIEFSITEDDIVIPEYCPVTGLKLQRHEKCLRWDSPSLDRIDNSKGYVQGNVAVISNKANMLKKNSTIDEVEKLLIYMRSANGLA